MLDEQKEIFDQICETIDVTCEKKKKVIVVRGDAGTGKTIVAASLLAKYSDRKIIYATPNPFIPTRWIIGDILERYRPGARSQLMDLGDLSKLSIENPIVLIDEAHKIETVHYDISVSNATVNSIIKKAQVCVFFCDPYQITRRYDEGYISSIENESEALNADFQILNLAHQYRCNGSTQYLDWLFGMLEMEDNLKRFVLSKEDYNFCICDSPSDVINHIIEKQAEGLSARVVIGNCYDKLQLDHGNVFGDKDFRWELTDCTRPNIWAKDSKYNQTVGGLFHCAGLEFDYVGILVGPDLFYRNGNVMADSRNRRLEKDYDFAEKVYDFDDYWFRSEDYVYRIKNLYYSLLTRGMRGCYVYFYDRSLANYFRKYVNVH